MTSNSLDPLVIATTLASIIFSPAIAAVVGPYAVIFIGAVMGAAIGLGRRQKETGRLGAFLFYLKMAGLAMLVTFPLAAMANSYLRFEESRWLLSPIALLVGGIGSNWRDVGEWVVRMLARRLPSSQKEDK